MFIHHLSKFGKFLLKIGGEIIFQSWLLLTPFSNLTIVHCVGNMCLFGLKNMFTLATLLWLDWWYLSFPNEMQRADMKLIVYWIAMDMAKSNYWNEWWWLFAFVWLVYTFFKACPRSKPIDASCKRDIGTTKTTSQHCECEIFTLAREKAIL